MKVRYVYVLAVSYVSEISTVRYLPAEIIYFKFERITYIIHIFIMGLNLNKENLNYFKIINITEPNPDHLVYICKSISPRSYILLILCFILN